MNILKQVLHKNLLFSFLIGMAYQLLKVILYFTDSLKEHNSNLPLLDSKLNAPEKNHISLLDRGSMSLLW